MKKHRVLILGASTKAGISVARSLYKYGCKVDMLDWCNLPVKYSRYIQKYYLLGDPSNDVESFVEKLCSHLDQHQYDFLLPLHDGAIELCILHELSIGKNCKILGLNPQDIYKYSANKSSLLNLAVQYGIKIPKSELIETIDNLDQISPGLIFPLAAKPVYSAKVVNNKLIQFKVQIVKNSEILIDYCREHILNSPILIQEYIEGYGIGYNFIATKGCIMHAYIHRRIHESKGVSSYREMLEPNYFGNEDQIKALIQAMRWNGVGMLEFKVTPLGELVLMELNGRFFGSTEVSVRSGIDLPVIYFKLLALNEVDNGFKITSPAKVRFLHDEVLLMFSAFFKGQFSFFFQWLLSLTDHFKSNCYIEDNIFKDPFYVFALYYWDLQRNINKLKRSVRLMLARPKVYQAKIYDAKNIAFVCYGNICRSPFAELYAKKINSKCKFQSFGVFSEQQRMPPIHALIAAENYGIDLSKHTSKTITLERSKLIDLVFVMDKKNYLALRDLGIEKSKIYLLQDQSIEDPFGKEISSFLICYKKISEKIDEYFKTS